MTSTDYETAERLGRKRARILPLFAILLLLVLATGGYWFRSREVRALMNDESTRAHRTDACRFGFFAAMIACVGLYVLSLFEPLSGRDVVHVVMSCGIGAALVRFGMLERRA